MELVSRDSWWPQLWKYIKEFIKSCNVCAQANIFCHHLHGLLQQLWILTSPWSSISMDFITNLPPSNSYDSILVMVDCLTKMAHFIACTKTITSEGTTKLFLDHVFGIMVFLTISFLIVGLNLHPSFGNDSLNF
jgi:hypothetical protein